MKQQIWMKNRISCIRLTILFLNFVITPHTANELCAFETDDPLLDDKKLQEETKYNDEEIWRDPERIDPDFWGKLFRIRPKRELMVEYLELPLRVEVRILTREILNFIRWRRPDIASTKFSNLKKLLPESDETYYASAALHFTHGNWDESEKDLLQAVSINPTHDPALFLLGCVYAMKRNWELSREYTERAIRRAPYSPYYRMNLAYIYFILDSKEKAHSQIQIILKQKPNFGKAFILGKLLGYNDWDTELSELRSIPKEILSYMEIGFPDELSKSDFVVQQIYTYYPIIDKTKLSFGNGLKP